MSTGLECLFVEPKPNCWYYILEHMDAPKCTWDWRNYATAYGPFTSEDEARKNLYENHANPGSSCTQTCTDGWEPDEVDQKLIDAAELPSPPIRFW